METGAREGAKHYSMRVDSGVFATMRDGTPHRPFYTHTDPQPIEPGRIYRYEIEAMPFSNVFRKGHRVRLEIVNGDSMLTDSLFSHQYLWYKIGTDSFHHDAAHPSRLWLPVVPGAATGDGREPGTR